MQLSRQACAEWVTEINKLSMHVQGAQNLCLHRFTALLRQYTKDRRAVELCYYNYAMHYSRAVRLLQHTHPHVCKRFLVVLILMM